MPPTRESVSDRRVGGQETHCDFLSRHRIILWFGWIGFNMGSALLGDRDRGYRLVSLAGVNTVLSGGTAGVTSVFYNYYYLDRHTGEPHFDLRYAMLGSLCGLAAMYVGVDWAFEGRLALSMHRAHRFPLLDATERLDAELWNRGPQLSRVLWLVYYTAAPRRHCFGSGLMMPSMVSR